jgi:hypothetical protein
MICCCSSKMLLILGTPPPSPGDSSRYGFLRDNISHMQTPKL